MDHRNHYVHLKPEDFQFVKPEIKATSSTSEEKDNISDKLKEVKELEEEEEEKDYFDEVFQDDDVSEVGSEVPSEKKDKQAYRPLASEIDEWRQAVQALSSRTVICNGRLFGDLDPVPFIDEVDPAPGACFNCWQLGHPSRNCPEPRTDFCINCGRRGEFIINCPRCCRQERDFFIRRRSEERRRAKSMCRERTTSAGTSREQQVGTGRSTSLSRTIRTIDGPRQVIKTAGAQGGSGSRAEARSRVADFGGKLEDGTITRGTAADRLGGPNKDHRRSNGGREAEKVVASTRRSRSRSQGWRSRQQRRQNPQFVNPTKEEKSEEKRRVNNEGKEPRLSSAERLAARRERPVVYTVVECRQEQVAGRTETRRGEERQWTKEGHVARERQSSALCWAEESRRICADMFVRYLKKKKPNEVGIIPKKLLKEPQKIPVNLDTEKNLKLIEALNHQLNSQDFSKLIKAMSLSRLEIDHIMGLLKEIQHYDRIKQQMIILDELLLESRESKWWKTENEDINI